MNVPPPAENDIDAPNLVPSTEHVGIELNLLASQGAFEKVGELPIIVQRVRNRGSFRRLESVYYDTPERLLFQRGMSLYVQRRGKRFIQTLELPPADGRPLERRRWEGPVDDIAPDLARLPADKVGNPIALTNSALVPVFTTNVRRRTQRLDLSDTLIEIVFDEGTIEAGTRQGVLSEIKLKLKSGNAGILFDLAEQLLDGAPLQLGTGSRAERGYRVAFDIVQPTAKARLPEITAEYVVDDVIALLTGSCWLHLLQNHAVAQESPDPEGVHQIRLALRRLRTICGMFRRDIPSPAFQAINADAKWLMQQLGRAREWDVFAEMVTGLVEAVPDIGLGGLCEAVDQQRRSSYEGVKAALADPRCSRFLLALGSTVERRGWRNEIDSESLTALSQPVSKLADKILTRLHRRTLKRGAHFRRLDFAAQHNLRIGVKKLRYAVEFLSPLYSTHAPAKRYVKRLARLQAGLGHARDIANSRILLDAIRRTDRPALYPSVGVVAGWQARDQLAAAKMLRKRWRRFKAAQTFWGE